MYKQEPHAADFFHRLGAIGRGVRVKISNFLIIRTPPWISHIKGMSNSLYENNSSDIIIIRPVDEW